MVPTDLGITMDQIVEQVQSFVSIPVVPVIVAVILAIGLVVIVVGGLTSIVGDWTS